MKHRLCTDCGHRKSAHLDGPCGKDGCDCSTYQVKIVPSPFTAYVAAVEHSHTEKKNEER